MKRVKVDCKRNKSLSATTVRVWRLLANKSTANQRKEHIMLKSTFSGLQYAVADNTGISWFV